MEAYWRRFVAATGIDGPYTAWGFGNSEQMATELGLLVRDGPKRATASLRSVYDGDEPMPRVGDLSVILDGRGRPLCVIRTTGVEVRRFGDVDAEFAWTEGEGDRSLEYLARGAHPLLRSGAAALRRGHRGRPPAIRAPVVVAR